MLRAIKKTQTYGGCNQSFMGYDMPVQLTANDNGDCSVISTQIQNVIIQEDGKEKEGTSACGQTANTTYRIIVESNQTMPQKIN
jgi:hypothetical protein